MNDHDDIRKLLAAYCGGDLETSERNRVEKHLSGCAPCRAELADLQTTLRLIRTTPEEPPPPWLATRIMARVREQQPEKRSWLQRIFFPLHVKLPLEALALLMLCVSGYYIARDVETGLQQPVIQQETKAGPPITAGPAASPEQQAPAALPPATHPPASAAGNGAGPAANRPARPPAPQAADQAGPQYTPEYQVKPSPQLPFAPALPAMKEERNSREAESTYGSTNAIPDSLTVHPAKRAKAAAPESKGNAGVTDDHGMSRLEAVSGASAPAANVAPLPRIRLSLAAPAAAPASLNEAVIRSGGVLVDVKSTEPRTLKARVPSLRFGELLEMLERLGKVVERPRIPEATGVVEIEITW